MQGHDLFHGGDALVAVQIAGGFGEAVIGQLPAEKPEIGVHIPVAHAGHVQGVGPPGLGGFDEGLHGGGHLVQTQAFQHIGVHNGGLTVGVQGQTVIFALIEVGGQGGLQIILGKLRKVRIVAEGGQTALLGVGGDVGNIHTGHVRAHAGAEGGDDHLMVLAAVLPDGLHMDVRVGFFPKGQHHVPELGFLTVAVCMPEGNGDGFRGRLSGAGGVGGLIGGLAGRRSRVRDRCVRLSAGPKTQAEHRQRQHKRHPF